MLEHHDARASIAGRTRAYHCLVTTNPPTGDEERRWEQPAFQPDAEQQVTPLTGRLIVPGATGRTPPSTFETVISTLARFVWPVAILLVVFTKAAFWPVLIVAIVLGTVLSAVSRNLRQQRRALPRPPSGAPDGSNFR